MCVPSPPWSGQTIAGLRDDLLVFGLRRAQQPRVVVGVRHRDAALAGRHRLDLVGVAALRLAREVRDDALRPGLRLRFADVRDLRGDQRQVVRMAARARADLALVHRIGERLRRSRRPTASPSPCCRRGCDRGCEKPNQSPSGSRIDAGMRSSSTFDFTGWNSPSCSACASRAASTISSTSAGLFAPSLFSRSSSCSSPASMRLILMPVCLVKFVVERLVGLVVARGIEVEHRLFGGLGERAQSAGRRRAANARDLAVMTGGRCDRGVDCSHAGSHCQYECESLLFVFDEVAWIAEVAVTRARDYGVTSVYRSPISLSSNRANRCSAARPPAR